jgi:uncharacterized protein (DUF433 family)
VDQTDKSFRLYGGKDPRDLPAYPLAMAAKFLLLPKSTLRVWVFGDTWTEKGGNVRSFKPLIVPPDRSEPILSFVNLVEAHVLKTIRRKHRIQMIMVRQAIDDLANLYQTEHPLADVDLLAGGAELFASRYEALLNLSMGRQIALHFLRMHLSRIERNIQNHSARLYPFVISPKRVGSELIDQDNRVIAIDPYISYGRPTLSGTGIPTDAIAERFWGGDSIEELAEDFGRTVTEIEYALRYERAQAQAAA